MTDGACDKSEEEKMKDSFHYLESMIRHTFVYYLNTDVKSLKKNLKIRKLENKFDKICRKYIKKYFEIDRIN
jgi:uncharacterized protein Yka (UPF0111/DUF47 family)